jgi:autotransporter-associated beta strand protein
MTIGNGATGYDSIASENSTAIINKTGAGSLVVNSSMQYFTGALNVNDGTMEANKGLGAKAINIANGAILGLQINGNNTLSNSSLVFTNNGTLILTSKVGLAEGDYTVSVANIADYGTTKTYGGIIVTGLTDIGEAYLYSNPQLKDPSIWDDKKYWINTAISLVALIVAIIALFKD